MRNIAYKSTDVPVERSQNHIRGLLIKYGALGIQFMEDFAHPKIGMRFRYDAQNKNDKTVTYMVRIDAVVQVAKSQKTQDQYQRAAWRAMYWALKSRMESIDYGIETFEEAFLSHFEAGVDEKGRSITIGQYIIPRLRAGQLALAEKASG